EYRPIRCHRERRLRARPSSGSVVPTTVSATERTGTVTAMSAGATTRRDFLFVATGAVGAIGAAATLVPLIAQMNPDASTIAAGVPIEDDPAPISEGQNIKGFWGGTQIC